MKKDEEGPIAYGYCCRRWPLYVWWPIGRCGYCNRRPTVNNQTPSLTYLGNEMWSSLGGVP